MTAQRDSFSHAIVRFNEALMAPETDLSRDAAISLAFEAMRGTR